VCNAQHAIKNKVLDHDLRPFGAGLRGAEENMFGGASLVKLWWLATPLQANHP
jgi:hypothetical protein